MTGVIILEETTVDTGLPFGMALALATAASIVSLLFILAILFNVWDEPSIIGIIIVAIISVLIINVNIWIWKSIFTDDNSAKEYTVQVDDSVSLNEFTERYEIISENGNTYVVREKPND